MMSSVGGDTEGGQKFQSIQIGPLWVVGNRHTERRLSCVRLGTLNNGMLNI